MPNNGQINALPKAFMAFCMATDRKFYPQKISQKMMPSEHPTSIGNSSTPANPHDL
jgi:hypothetical protein